MKIWWSARRLPRALRRALRERRSLESRPWEEELLHWARDGTLHGTMIPPPDSRRRSTTADGWCPGWARELQRTYLSNALDGHDGHDDSVEEESKDGAGS